MRKTVLAGLIAGALGIGGIAQAAPLIISLDGTGGNVISATGLDWAPTTFFALGGKGAIQNFLFNPAAGTTFDVLTMAKLTGYTDAAGNAGIGLPGGPTGFKGEITIVTRFTERVTGATAGAGGSGSATFETTGDGWLEMYYSATPNSDQLTGANFNDGTLIMRGRGVSAPDAVTSDGLFQNSAGSVVLDQFAGAAPANDYPGQNTVRGIGIQGEIKYGSGGFVVDNNFLKTAVGDFSIFFNSIGINLPFGQVDPADCFNPNQGLGSDAQITAGTATGQLTQCQPNHFLGTYAQNVLANGQDGGLVPVIGAVNGAFGANGPDFIAQTDFNSSVTGSVPEPGMLALLGLAFAGLGLTTMRRRRA